MPCDYAEIIPSPGGIVLIISPYNYPFQLAMMPLCGAIAAGNCAVIKPSELAENSARTIARLIPRYLDKNCYAVVEGGPEIFPALLELKFDHVFYTGSFNVAREIHGRVNKYLTKCTFELGGKSPVYLDESVDMRMAAERIMWGKTMVIWGVIN
jgi:acyl-CoA reductase-like NAD-dependent aldehyde dehydrogenase